MLFSFLLYPCIYCLLLFPAIVVNVVLFSFLVFDFMLLSLTSFYDMSFFIGLPFISFPFRCISAYSLVYVMLFCVPLGLFIVLHSILFYVMCSCRVCYVLFLVSVCLLYCRSLFYFISFTCI